MNDRHPVNPSYRLSSKLNDVFSASIGAIMIQLIEEMPVEEKLRWWFLTLVPGFACFVSRLLIHLDRSYRIKLTDYRERKMDDRIAHYVQRVMKNPYRSDEQKELVAELHFSAELDRISGVLKRAKEP